ncbi:MAG: hypothetical protein P1V36_04255 [Planctomycetota bacterium]|nr:hypothetical protein [Planctomycetota bacterium]
MVRKLLLICAVWLSGHGLAEGCDGRLGTHRALGHARDGILVVPAQRLLARRGFVECDGQLAHLLLERREARIGLWRGRGRLDGGGHPEADDGREDRGRSKRQEESGLLHVGLAHGASEGLIGFALRQTVGAHAQRHDGFAASTGHLGDRARLSLQRAEVRAMLLPAGRAVERRLAGGLGAHAWPPG